MLAYRSAKRSVEMGDALADLEARTATLEPSAASLLDDVRSLLIRAGQLEAAVVDAQSPVVDDISPTSDAFGQAMQDLAVMFARIRAGKAVPRPAVDAATMRLRALRSRSPVGRVCTSVPEGFAYYGLFPETYLDAARALASTLAPDEAVVIGIRGIGTTLSAVVAAELVEQGIPVERLTVRPRGHPFDRELRLSRKLSDRLRSLAARPGALFAVVDEGPGLSGSSFASVVAALRALGTSEERIVLFPSWSPAPELLSNARARTVWARHRRFLGDFESTWIHNGRLARMFGAAMMRDLSAGAWRDLFGATGIDRPVVQPQHERRKFLAERGDQHMLIKFEGLDDGAAERRARADRLAAAGFGVPVSALRHGFVAMPWMDGTPLTPRDAGPVLLACIARYVAWNARHERTGTGADPEPLLELVRVNAGEAFGAGWGHEAVSRLGRLAADVARAPAVRVDGRMMPHEWLRTSSGFVKTDGGSHYDDHFYPGEHDAAWDLAGAVLELELDDAAAGALTREYAAASGDQGIAPRLAFMRIAYAAFRLGYTTLATAALGDTPDGAAMHRAATRYSVTLRRELAAIDSGGQSYATGT